MADELRVLGERYWESQPYRKGPQHECGVFGVWGHQEAAHLALYGMIALQHRGQESAGLAVSDGEQIRSKKGMGLVLEALHEDDLHALPGSAALGHVRYSTTGSSNLVNAQPLVVRGSRRGSLAFGHNGNLTNAHEVRRRLEEEGSIFQTTTDTEVLAHLTVRSRADNLADALCDALEQVRGGYALLVLGEKELIAVRDPHGIRPLSLGRLGSAWVFASETVAFDVVGAEFVRDVAPGEMVIVGAEGLESRQALPPGPSRLCVFEHIYFARPDALMGGQVVHEVRKALGRQLAREHPAEADVVIGVPDSSISAAMGYAEGSGIPYEVGLVKNRYIGRTFIQPSQEMRSAGVRLKLNPLRHLLEGKRVVLVDDSIVRGTTSRRLVSLVREAGAKEVHMRISSPPYRFACHYGIDTSRTAELIATNREILDIERYIGADSLRYLSIEGMLAAVARERQPGYCTACFNAVYPVPIPENGADKFAFEAKGAVR